MIKSFKDKETEKIFRGRFSRKLPRDIQRLAARKLEQIVYGLMINGGYASFGKLGTHLTLRL